jgi:hypothetical protein
MTVKESGVVAAIQKAVKKAYPRAYCVKLADRFRRGLPDLMILFKHKVSWSGFGDNYLACLFVEVKRPAGGRLSAIQHAEAEKIAAVGAAGLGWLCVTSPEEVLAKMKEMGGVP